MKPMADKKNVDILEGLILKKQQRLTINEAAALSGMAIDDVKDALEVVMDRYYCRLQVTESGDIIYDFGKRPRRRNAVSLKERLLTLLEWFWAVFTVIFKAWITVTLVVYFGIFLLALVAILLFASGGRGGGGGGNIDLRGIERWLKDIFNWRTNTGKKRNRWDRRGYRYKEYEPRPGVLRRDRKSFISAVYDFVFGPQRVEIDLLNNQKEVAAYLLENRGILTTAELQALAGWDKTEADEFFTECLVRFHGEVDVSDEGVVYGKFDDILRRAGEGKPGKIVYYWDEYEPEYQLTGNSAGQNFWAAFMNGFNLFFSLVVLANLFPLFLEFDPGLADIGWIRLAFGWIPLTFSILFFLIPMVRTFPIGRANQRRYRNNVRKRIFQAIFENGGAPMRLADVQARVNDHDYEEKLPSPIIQKTLEQLLIDLEGDMQVGEDGELRYAFPRIQLEMSHLPALRAANSSSEDLGGIVLDTEEPLQ